MEQFRSLNGRTSPLLNQIIMSSSMYLRIVNVCLLCSNMKFRLTSLIAVLIFDTEFGVFPIDSRLAGFLMC